MSARSAPNPTSYRSADTNIITLPSGASYPEFLEPLTSNELALLETFAAIKSYEKEAARIKAEEAKRRLEEADEKYRAKLREREAANSNGDDGDHGGESKDGLMDNAKQQQQYQDDENDDSDEEEQTMRPKVKEREISQLRKDVAAAREAKEQQKAERLAAKQKEEALRREFLGQSSDNETATMFEEKISYEDVKKRSRENDEYNDDSDEEGEEDGYDSILKQFSTTRTHDTLNGPVIKKKRKDNASLDSTKPQPSLIANIGGDATPIHEFSKKLAMSKSSIDGTIIFPKESGQTIGRPWKPIDGCMELELPDFDPTMLGGSYSMGNNTIAIKFHAPDDSNRFSINIAAPNHDNYNNVLFHFNPRNYEHGGKLVINNRIDSTWGNDLAVPLSRLSLMFGMVSCTLVIQINESGFDIFVDGLHCARFEHRTDLLSSNLWRGNNKKGSLFLQFPNVNDYDELENWVVYRVWWGRKDSMAGDLSEVYGVDAENLVHPKKLFISKLPKINQDYEVELRKADLERAFRKYGGPQGIVAVIVPKDKSYAFVEVASKELADLAITEMSSGNKYTVNKARMTKHEALLEEREANEATGKGTAKESHNWDS